MGALDSFAQIDLSAVEELARLNQERATVGAWLAGISRQRRPNTSAQVLDRVSRDYEARLAALEERCRRPAAAARAELDRLLEMHGRSRAALEAATYDEEEVELRSRLGELAPEEYEARRARCREELQRRRAEVEEGDRLQECFLAALEPERATVAAVLPPPTVPPTSAAAEAPSSATVLLSRQTMAAVREEANHEAEAVSSPGVSAGSEEVPAGATMILRHAKLVVASGERKGEEWPVGLRGCVVGSATDCDIVLPDASVVQRHAHLALEARGYVVRDLGGPAGTRVNGGPVGEAALQDGDRLELGEVELVFRHA